MQRRWQVHPDETGQVSREALIGALIDAAAILDIAGGTLSVVTGRAPTGLPGEMVMTGAILEWRDRTDAKPQPEQASSVTPEQKRDDFAAEIEQTSAEVGEALDQVDEAIQGSDANPDGFDYSKLADEDVEEPEMAR